MHYTRAIITALFVVAGATSASAQSYYDFDRGVWRSADTSTSVSQGGTGMNTGPDSSIGLGNTDGTGMQIPDDGRTYYSYSYSYSNPYSYYDNEE